MKFSPSEKQFFDTVRQEDPEIDQLFRDIRQMSEFFRGSRLQYLMVRGSEWGKDFPDGEKVAHFPRPETIPKGIKANQKALTAGQRRRAMTKYK